MAGVVHVVRRGQTLYRIARTYGIEPADLMQANGIDRPADAGGRAGALRPGRRPGARRGGGPRRRGAGRAAAPRRDRARAQGDGGPPPPAALEARPRLDWPLKGVLYGRFGVRGGAHHDGIDIAAPEGSPVVAAADGSVIFVGQQSGYGTVVILRHERGLVTVYAHNSAVLVHEGERVTRGQLVARVGQTGRTTGPHLHFEVREGIRPRNPLLYFP